MTTGDIAAGGVFMALGHGNMSFGDAIASEVFLSDYAILNLGGLTATCVGACGTGGADGVVTAPPTGPSYSYVTTAGGVDGAGHDRRAACLLPQPHRLRHHVGAVGPGGRRRAGPLTG